jgi:hypothetical protein
MRTKELIKMKAWTVKFKSFNKEDYQETVSGKNEKEARKNANYYTVRRDQRDMIESITEDTTVKGWY